MIDFFKQRGHSKVVALVPQWRRQAPTVDRPISDQDLLETLKEQGTLTFTPSRRIGNRNISCYDDRYVPVEHLARVWCNACPTCVK